MTAHDSHPSSAPGRRAALPAPAPPAPASPARPTSPPAPVLTARQAADLRADLGESGWGVDAVAVLIGSVAEAALRREIRLPALRAVRAALEAGRQADAGPSPVAVLTALFMLGEPVRAAELDSALPRTGARGAARIGLVALEGREEAEARGDRPGRAVLARALVDLRPHEARDDAGEARWWVASDVGELVSGQALAPDHVLGIGGAGLTLAGLAPRRPVGDALDLGCGCGIQSLYLARHAERITATDISERALAFTAFNAALAGIAPERLELLAGSFLEPLGRRRYDLIVSNPPFVLTPPAVREAGLPLMEYRDAGGPVLPRLVPGLAGMLADGGTLVMLGNWEHGAGADWRASVGEWFPDDVDAWVIERDAQDPVEYATMWLRDGGLAPERERDAFEAALGAWIGDFEARGVEAIGFGYLLAHRPEAVGAGSPRRGPWRVLEEVSTSPSGALGAHIAASIAVRGRLALLDDDDVAALRPVVAADVTEERYLVPGRADPSVILLRQGGGLGRSVQAGTALAALIGVADGELSIAQIAGAVAALLDADAEALTAELVAQCRDLAAWGMLSLPPAP
ncbi:N5-glutamine methyltransferase family protein [Actinomyces marmotae]|uniref:N5-glutamine methyltransferase family protein n=1 Tax=Actinomyces marmotae TaxID=2737173 RepID=UPI00135701BC|nr:class I SAM-dependent methyltransferase [Actinomyces marmotae]